MKSLHLLPRLSLIAILILLAGCKPAATPLPNPPVTSPEGKIRVCTVNYPLAYFAERIGANLVDVRFDAPPGEDPAFWEPSDADIAAFQQADLMLLNGATYAKWLDHVSLPASTQVNTAARFETELIKVEEQVTHSHGKDGDHSHGGIAFTTWLDFSLATKQAAAVHAALIKKLPDHASTLDSNFAALKSDLQSLDAEMAALGKKLRNQPLLASHPVYQYLARRYHLDLQSVLWEPGIHPPAKEWETLDKVLADYPANLMLWENTPHPDTADALNQRGIKPVIFNQAGNRPATGDWLASMRAGIASLAAALEND